MIFSTAGGKEMGEEGGEVDDSRSEENFQGKKEGRLVGERS